MTPAVALSLFTFAFVFTAVCLLGRLWIRR